MKKQFNSYMIIWTVAVVVFNAVINLVPAPEGQEKYTNVFWIGYALIMLAFVGQFIASFVFFKDDSNKEKVFLNLPVFSLSIVALVLSVVAATIFMSIPNVPEWVAAVVAIIITGFFVIAIVSSKLASDAVFEIEQKIEVQKFFIKSLTADCDSLISKAKSDEMATLCKKAYEAVRYSDPMSREALSAIESQITIKFSEFSEAVENDSINDASRLAKEFLILVDDRNKKCKLFI